MEEYDEDPHAGLDDMTNKFIVDEGDDGIESDEEELFDSVCAYCDNGGDILCCEGRCIRSFHASADAGEESNCDGLGLSITQVKAMQTFLCPNCQHKIHQCFACGKLGSSDNSSGAEVFHCISATCGYFYHPECVAKLLHPMDEAKAKEVQNRISEGESFTCPVHKCYICKQGEDKDIPELQFAVCRRCPKAYHRKCLPRKIVFEDLEEEGILARAWDDLLPYNRILIYCLKHKIDKNLKTPMRNHILFPHFEDKEKKRRLEQLVTKKNAALERRYVDTEDSFRERFVKVPKHAFFHDVKHSGSMMERKKPFTEKELYNSEKPRMSDAFKKPPRDNFKINNSPVDKHRVLLGEERFNWSGDFKYKDKGVTSSKSEGFTKNAPPRKRQMTYQVDEKTKKRIMNMWKESESLITVEEIVKGHKLPSIYAHSSKVLVDKTITLGKVEGFVEAVRTSLKKLEEGGSIEDAKAVCGPEILNQIIRWKMKLTVYLSPFLHGNRYTSYGRHFTKMDKLKEEDKNADVTFTRSGVQIVDKLRWYIQDGDTIVDFCCGSNDFSWLMKQKLEESGKRCTFKNFDIIQPKNDFCFEKRDWMTVRLKELPVGNNLIMGLNPPFGVKAALANQFINKALEFRPKLIILIVPPETKRLDRKSPYDLIWEDTEKLSGKSFYLPGSVDVNDNQIEQWNQTAPVLYLWSHSDWTPKHMDIAQKHGHVSKDLRMEENHDERQFSKNRKAVHFPGHCSGDDLRRFQPGHGGASGLEYSTGYTSYQLPVPTNYQLPGHDAGTNTGSLLSASHRDPGLALESSHGSQLPLPTINLRPGHHAGADTGSLLSASYGVQGLALESSYSNQLPIPTINQFPGQDAGTNPGSLLPASYRVQGLALESSHRNQLHLSTINQLSRQHAGTGTGSLLSALYRVHDSALESPYGNQLPTPTINHLPGQDAGTSTGSLLSASYRFQGSALESPYSNQLPGQAARFGSVGSLSSTLYQFHGLTPDSSYGASGSRPSVDPNMLGFVPGCPDPSLP